MKQDRHPILHIILYEHPHAFSLQKKKERKLSPLKLSTKISLAFSSLFLESGEAGNHIKFKLATHNEQKGEATTKSVADTKKEEQKNMSSNQSKKASAAQQNKTVPVGMKPISTHNNYIGLFYVGSTQ